jgi:ABC-type glycerol-3-phosphate transport system substrate-binding protein
MVRKATSALALVTVLALAACAGPAQSDGEALMPTPTQSVEPENVETDEPSAEPTAEIDPAAEG